MSTFGFEHSLDASRHTVDTVTDLLLECDVTEPQFDQLGYHLLTCCDGLCCNTCFQESPDIFYGI